jgi:hypothetical protein
MKTSRFGNFDQPKGIMKKGSGGGGGSDGLGEEVLAEIECIYHLHTRTRAPCWRANIQMYSPESGLGRRHIFNERYGMHRKSKRRAREEQEKSKRRAREEQEKSKRRAREEQEHIVAKGGNATPNQQRLHFITTLQYLLLLPPPPKSCTCFIRIS